TIYASRSITDMQGIKKAFDPHNILNPCKSAKKKEVWIVQYILYVCGNLLRGVNQYEKGKP
ncbi:FAD-linked oxidase C-terminal domain-containing protein, partial [Pectinatus cerevisiiphilus]|uniref:FAD-linked oxidase C-terminal domain-containing protein n=1 Tax=Pectinatus cerevisiiphilus TaxID=86956 RepID=UPI0018C4B2E2